VGNPYISLDETEIRRIVSFDRVEDQDMRFEKLLLIVLVVGLVVPAFGQGSTAEQLQKPLTLGENWFRSTDNKLIECDQTFISLLQVEEATGSLSMNRCFSKYYLLRTMKLNSLPSSVDAEFRVPSLVQNPQPPVAQPQGRRKRLELAILGGGLMALGVVLAANAEQTTEVSLTAGPRRNTFHMQETSSWDWRRATGISVTIGGGVLVWYGLR
jgi:hypothetical protein